jgi:hypothetical protein
MPKNINYFSIITIKVYDNAKNIMQMKHYIDSKYVRQEIKKVDPLLGSEKLMLQNINGFRRRNIF